MKNFLVYKDIEEIDRLMVTMLVKRIRIHSGKLVSMEFWFEDEFERLTTLLQTINKIEPNEALTSFLEKNQRGGNLSA